MRLIVLVTVLRSLDGAMSVIKCPFEERGWKIREKKFSCKEDHGFTYHCLLDLSGHPVEVCLKRREYRGGCPWVLQTDEGTFLGAPLTSCKNERYCPGDSKRFYSNQLYLHQACLVKEEERPTFTLPDILDYDDDNSNTSASPNQKYQRDESNFKMNCLGTILLSILLLLLLILAVIGLVLRAKGISATQNKSRGFEQEMETRGFLEVKGKCGDPGKAYDIISQWKVFRTRSRTV